MLGKLYQFVSADESGEKKQAGDARILLPTFSSSPRSPPPPSLLSLFSLLRQVCMPFLAWEHCASQTGRSVAAIALRSLGSSGRSSREKLQSPYHFVYSS